MGTRYCNELRLSTAARAFLLLILSLVALIPRSAALADSIYVVDGALATNAEISAVRTDLANLGYTLTHGGPLGDYSGYNQVWDLRYSTALSAADTTVYNNYLSGGGRLYLTGEGSSFAARNTSVISYVNQAGGGLLTIANGGFLGTQLITADGQIVTSPNSFGSLTQFNAASTVSISSGNGFLVSEVGTTNTGSLVGWDFGDIVGKPDARMLVGFDLEIFRNGPNWTQDMAQFLDTAEPVSAPLPLTAWMGVALFSCLLCRRILCTRNLL